MNPKAASWRRPNGSSQTRCAIRAVIRKPATRLGMATVSGKVRKAAT